MTGAVAWCLHGIAGDIGAAIGGLIGYMYHRKAVNAAQDIIDEIEMN